ncbi:hypothetical protein H0H93_003918 [Arthromyces matolae]|nr:hypothetical protein H0H93_003918 [Arthromyces matolae]
MWPKTTAYLSFLLASAPSLHAAVISSGTAGNVIANRLTENPKYKVLIIEAGGSQDGVTGSEIPFLGGTLTPNTPYDWNYTTTPQVGLGGRSISYPRGHIMGGSSSVIWMKPNHRHTQPAPGLRRMDVYMTIAEERAGTSTNTSERNRKFKACPSAWDVVFAPKISSRAILIAAEVVQKSPMSAQPDKAPRAPALRKFSKSNPIPESGSSLQRPKPILFYDKHEAYYEFTNFSNHPFRYNGHQYKTSEHLFQALKLIDSKFVDTRPEIAKQIRGASSPRDVFNIAQNNRQYQRPDWRNVSIAMDETKTDIRQMDIALLHKFQQHKELKDKLLATGNAELIENSPVDSFWGNGADKGFAWLWHDLTTLESYDFELAFVDRTSIRGAHGGGPRKKADALIAQGGGTATITETAALHVLASVTQKAKKLFVLIGTRQLESIEDSDVAGAGEKDLQQFGIGYDILFNVARDDFIATSDTALRSLLGEFRDHSLVVSGQGTTGSGEMLWIPLRKERLASVLKSLKEEN